MGDIEGGITNIPFVKAWLASSMRMRKVLEDKGEKMLPGNPDFDRAVLQIQRNRELAEAYAKISKPETPAGASDTALEPA